MALQLGLRFRRSGNFGCPGMAHIHVVGLNIDPTHPQLLTGLESVRASQITLRAEQMAADLARIGIGGSFEGALAFAGNKDMVVAPTSRAFWSIVARVRDIKAAFKKYLVKANGLTPHQWAELERCRGLDQAAGGRAVLAHPGRYEIGAASHVAPVDLIGCR